MDFLSDFFGDVDDGFEFGDGRAAFAELVDQFQALRVWLDVAILFNALVDLRFSEGAILECEFLADAEEVGGFPAESLELRLEKLDALAIILDDALDEEAFYLGAFEDDAHDKVVDILVFDEFAAVVGGKLPKPVHLGDDCY